MKLKVNSLRKVIGLFSIILWFTYCAGPKKVVEVSERPQLNVPVGVDSSIAKEADSLSKELFVPWDQQQIAEKKKKEAEEKFEMSNKLWDALQMKQDSSTVQPEDTVKAIEKFNEAAKQLIALQKLQKNDRLAEEDIRKQVLGYLESAQRELEESIQLNPFDRQTRLLLSQVYKALAERFLKMAAMEKAATILENLVRLEKDQHGLYGRLAQIYLALKKWDQALENFKRAERVLRETAIFQVPDTVELDSTAIAAALDSSTLFLYVYYQAESNIRMFRSEEALKELRRSLIFARNDGDRNVVKTTIDWIEWDDGNIRASEIRDTLLAKVDNGEYQLAANGFQKLIPMLRTAKALREINWRLALLEYTFLNKEETALQRMQTVVNYFLSDTTGKANEDTLSKEYFKSYGTMSHNQGLKFLSQKKYLTALTYFKQAVSIPWEQRAKSYVELAKLSINNPKRASEFALAAWNEKENLTGEEKQTALKILIEALKRQGQFEKARNYFLEFRKLSQRIKNVNASN